VQMTLEQNGSANVAAVRAVVEAWLAAIKRRDMAAILKNHSPDLIMFDVPLPFQSRGLDAYRKTWDLFFSCQKDPVRFDPTELNITAGAEVAFVVATMQCGPSETLDFRLTMGLRKIDGQWTITHEHHSVPAPD
jgi:ketosteroid isomerase-like protein